MVTHGHRHTDETKQKLSIALQGNKNGIGNKSNSGRHLPLEQRQNISKGNMGRVFSDETIEKIRISNKKKMTHEKRVKLSISHMKENLSDETRKRLSDSKKGHTVSQETREKIRKKLLGFKHTNETKQKLKEQRLHQVFPQKDSKIERIIQIALSLEGIKFEKHKAIIGQPDIFIEPNICIFVDGCYWHGCDVCHNESVRNGQIPTKCKKRDAIVNQKLSKYGYDIIRFWEHEIQSDIDVCMNRVRDTVIAQPIG